MTAPGAVDRSQVHSSQAAPGATPILLDVPLVRLLLDALGAIALFTTAAIALSVRDAVLVTAAVALLVLASRLLRTIGVGGEPAP